MAWLGLDTATPFLAAALWSPRRGLLASTVERVEREHASRLVPLLEELLSRADLERSALEAIAVGQGPGSYTGLRVGVAAARGLARALALPLAGCDTLAAMAAAALADGEEGLCALDARRGNVYVGRYRRQGERVLTLAAPRKEPRAAVIESHPHLRLLEGLPPDPAYVARQARSGQSPRPLYL